MKGQLRAVRELIEYQLLLSARSVVRLCPARLAVALGALLGQVVGRLVRARRQTVLENLRLALPEATERERRRIANRSYAQAGRSLMETLRLGRLSPEQLERLVALKGEEHLGAGLALGKGVVLVTGHFGSWELLGARLTAAGFPVHVLYKKLHNTLVDESLRQSRHSVGLGTIPQGAALRGISKALRRNEVVGFLFDQDARRDGIFVDFFGRPASTFQGPAMFALRSGAALIPVFIHRLGGHRHCLHLHPPLDLAGLEPDPRSIALITARLNSRLEEEIRERPDHYFWLHKRWRTRPPRQDGDTTA
jgi:KDO2-lipid IV(A) lauroyltransferase